MHISIFICRWFGDTIVYMVFVLILSFFVIAFLVFLFIVSSRYSNPYKLYLILGKKGSGKTTYLVRIADQFLSKKRTVYSNFPIDGTFLFDTASIDNGTYDFEYGSIVLIDEAGTTWDSRNYAKFSSHARDFFKYQRKLGLIVYLASQTADVDIKIRVNADCILLFRCFFNVFSIGQRYYNRIVVVHPVGDSEARITDDLEPATFLSFFTRYKPFTITYIPKYSKRFDTKLRL